MGILIALLIFSFLIFFHELGHFLVARYWGVKVEVFSIGFGKRLYTKQIGETEWSISAIPLGGYVRMKGQDDSDPLAVSYDADSYTTKTPWQKITILLAGPAANFVVAFFLYFVLALGDIPKALPVVGDLNQSLPAYKAGMQNGDRIMEINGHPISYWEDISTAIKHSSTEELHISVLRDQQYLMIDIKPETIQDINAFGESVARKVIGITHQENAIVYLDLSLAESTQYAYDQTVAASLLIIKGVQKLITGAISSENVSGPIGITDMISKATQVSIAYLLFLTALLSVNLGVLNLLPIPALDGGHIMFNLYEWIRGQQPSEEVMYRITLIGWGVLFSIMLLGFYNDIHRMVLT